MVMFFSSSSRTILLTGSCRYAESEIEPYLRDAIFDAAENQTRLFLSHITSTTHHPWAVPDSFHQEMYMGFNDGLRSRHQDLNHYLNAVAYVDQWIGKILGYIDEANLTDSTLVVMIGDQ
jgi:phosphoglycerol transferase MdoB-like AlkP superfamily enzyme